jgi:hypothetical protein
MAGYLRASKAIFPQILARCFRIAGIYCRQRWFVRYARSESLLCVSTSSYDLRPMCASGCTIALPC